MKTWRDQQASSRGAQGERRTKAKLSAMSNAAKSSAFSNIPTGGGD